MAAQGREWQDIAKEKRDAIHDSIPKSWLTGPLPSAEQQRDVTGDYICRYLSRNEIDITEKDAVDIVKKTSSGEWTAEDVTRAFCHRASLAHQFVNCLLETFFDAAIEDAKKLDEYFAQYKKPIGPLHGLPVSLKDQFHVKGVETSMGYVGWIGTFEGRQGTAREKVFESEMVKELRNLGAVLFCKTSVPHTLMCGETVNNILGYTSNPKNRNLSSGGSSGGEGALISLKGSPVGFGTDIGGSIRIPAAFNGLYGLRPSSGRLPYEGMANSMDGQNTVLSVVGPLSHSAASLRFVTRALLSQEPWLHDPLVHEIPWREEQERQILKMINNTNDRSEQLAFGFLKHDGSVTPHPPVRRAMDLVQETIQQLGHKIVDWQPPAHGAGIKLVETSWAYDGGEDIHKSLGLSGEPLLPHVPVRYRNKPLPQCNATEIAATNVAKREYQKKYMDYWNTTKEKTGTDRPVDALIMPLAPFAAARPKEYKYYGYSSIINLLDYTSCSFPVSVANKSIDVIDHEFKPTDNRDKEIMATYDPDIYDGAPVALQIVGRRLQEEKVLALAEYLGQAIKSGSTARSKI